MQCFDDNSCRFESNCFCEKCEKNLGKYRGTGSNQLQGQIFDRYLVNNQACLGPLGNESDGNDDHDFFERLIITEDKDGVDDNGDDDDGNVWSIFRLVQATQGKLHGNGGKRATK